MYEYSTCKSICTNLIYKILLNQLARADFVYLLQTPQAALGASNELECVARKRAPAIKRDNQRVALWEPRRAARLVLLAANVQDCQLSAARLYNLPNERHGRHGV